MSTSVPIQIPCKVAVGIDFGTRGTGFTYSRIPKYGIPNQKSSQIILDMGWNGENDVRKKTTTSVLFSRDTAIAFGLEAEKVYEESKSSDNYLFKRFKMQLYESKSRECTSVCGRKTISAEEVFTGSLKMIKEFILKKLNLADLHLENEYDGSVEMKLTNSEASNEIADKLNSLEEYDVLWVLTVPAIWDEAGKSITKRSARRAGMTNIEIALEPEAAALTIKYDKFPKPILNEGTRFIVVDAGAGTIDIVSLKVRSFEEDSKLSFEEIAPATGGPGGSTKVDSEFLKTLCEIFFDYELEDFFEKNPDEQNLLLNEFEKRKEEASSDMLIIRLPPLLGEFMKNISDIDDVLKTWSLNKGYSEDEIRYSKRGSCIKVKMNLFKKLHHVCISELDTRLLDLFKGFKDSDISYILFVGGFSKSPFMKEFLQKFCSDRNITFEFPRKVPEELAVVNGATLYGLNPREIQSRRMRFSYGVLACYSFNQFKHSDKMESTLVVENKRYVQKFAYFVEKGELIDLDQEILHYFSPIADCDHLEFPIKYSSSTDEIYAQDENLHHLGNLVVRLQGSSNLISKNDILLFSMKFGGTMIRCHATNKSLGIDKEVELEFR
jgi:molecular chaperone DnaK (HSP70)